MYLAEEKTCDLDLELCTSKSDREAFHQTEGRREVGRPRWEKERERERERRVNQTNQNLEKKKGRQRHRCQGLTQVQVSVIQHLREDLGRCRQRSKQCAMIN